MRAGTATKATRGRCSSAAETRRWCSTIWASRARNGPGAVTSSPVTPSGRNAASKSSGSLQTEMVLPEISVIPRPEKCQFAATYRPDAADSGIGPRMGSGPRVGLFNFGESSMRRVAKAREPWEQPEDRRRDGDAAGRWHSRCTRFRPAPALPDCARPHGAPCRWLVALRHAGLRLRRQSGVRVDCQATIRQFPPGFRP